MAFKPIFTMALPKPEIRVSGTRPSLSVATAPESLPRALFYNLVFVMPFVKTAANMTMVLADWVIILFIFFI